MTFRVHEAERLSIQQMREFLQGSRQLEFALQSKAAIYEFLERVLQARHYGQLKRSCDPPYPAARAHRLWQSRFRAARRSVGVAFVQPAPVRSLSPPARAG